MCISPFLWRPGGGDPFLTAHTQKPLPRLMSLSIRGDTSGSRLASFSPGLPVHPEPLPCVPCGFPPFTKNLFSQALCTCNHLILKINFGGRVTPFPPEGEPRALGPPGAEACPGSVCPRGPHCTSSRSLGDVTWALRGLGAEDKEGRPACYQTLITIRTAALWGQGPGVQ